MIAHITGKIVKKCEDSFIIENNGKSVCTDTLKTWNTDELFFALTGTNSVHNAHTITPGIYNNVIKQVLAKSHDDNNDDNDDNDDNDQ